MKDWELVMKNFKLILIGLMLSTMAAFSQAHFIIHNAYQMDPNTETLKKINSESRRMTIDGNFMIMHLNVKEIIELDIVKTENDDDGNLLLEVLYESNIMGEGFMHMFLYLDGDITIYMKYDNLKYIYVYKGRMVR